MKKINLLLLLVMMFFSAAAEIGTIRLANNSIRITWLQTSEGWKISQLQLNIKGKWTTVAHPSGEYTLLYAEDKPANGSGNLYKTVTGAAWPDTVYRYLLNVWKQGTSPVSLNTAGTAYDFFPATAKKTGNNSIRFTHETPWAMITAEWKLDEQFPGDVQVKQNMVCKKNGYYSLASPSIATVKEEDMEWATMPGYFQGNEIQKDFVLSHAYGQGVPELPVIYRERCASSLCPIITTKQHISLTVIPQPGLARDPWTYDKNTHQDWFIALSHKNRKSQLSPTIYYPVLGETGSRLQIGNEVSYQFRYSLMHGEWFRLLEHAVNDIYQFKKSLPLRRNKQSLTSRIAQMQRYLSDRATSLWNVEEYNGLKIGGQSYLGGVVGSDRDAVKNSDYGAMWMLANTSGDVFLKDSVLPYALNFKLAQQQTDTGFFQGAAIGQYYLSKRKKFIEEWGEFIEPVSLTYYIMLDIGNILLFDSTNDELRKRLQLGASLLLKWQKPDGSWEVAYDRHTKQPLFTDIKDLRPTFYGLMVAYRILKDPKYLAAAKKGADWFIKNAVTKGNFIGVCGDARYVPDFATAQSAQALLDLYDLTGEKKYETAALQTARMYLTSVYTQPVASGKMKVVNGISREDWEISQSGLTFEHGGVIGSANTGGPITLCSHAGLFVRMFQLSKDSLFIEMARAAAIGRDAFVDSKTSVASYYWNAMNKGAGPYPHHAWWQIGWIMDYLMSEIRLRSENKIIFPRGFITPKVGPHESYGFAPGKIYNESANLLISEGLLEYNSPNIEHIMARSNDRKKLFLILLNDTGEEINDTIQLNSQKLQAIMGGVAKKITELNGKNTIDSIDSWKIQLKGYGLKVYRIEL